MPLRHVLRVEDAVWWVSHAAVIRSSGSGNKFCWPLNLLGLLLHRVALVDASKELKNVCMLFLNCCILHCRLRRSVGWHEMVFLVKSSLLLVVGWW